MRWQLPLIIAYSVTTHKSQSIIAHNGIVYEKKNYSQKVYLILPYQEQQTNIIITNTSKSFHGPKIQN